MGSRSGPGSSGVLSSASVGGNGGGVVVMWIASSGKLFERGGTVDSVGSADNVLVAKATITSRVPDTGGIIVFWLAAIFIVEYCFVRTSCLFFIACFPAHSPTQKKRRTGTLL